MRYEIWNNFKTTVLMGGLFGLCMGLGYLFAGPRAVLPALVIAGVMNVVAFFFSDKIALSSVRARQVERETDEVLYETVERLSARARLAMPRVYISPASAPNAFATGRGPRHSSVCVTAGLRRMLNEQELAGVISHELSHIKHRDILISTVAAIIAGAITYLTYVGLFFGGDDDEGNPLVALLLLIFAPVAAGLIQMAISRSREFEADRSGAELAGSGEGLAESLRKMSSAARKMPLRVPDSQSNMFIVAPFTGRRMARMFMTHPPVKERIARLMKMEEGLR